MAPPPGKRKYFVALLGLLTLVHWKVPGAADRFAEKLKGADQAWWDDLRLILHFHAIDPLLEILANLAPELKSDIEEIRAAWKEVED
ncbi:MAG: hypothetical protein HY717_19385 [Planctomycetes bacterium]|nr:hypothetical protein [Planctomycetota bacterium]